MNTRTHYRNSTLAFPKTADYGCAITRKRPVDRAVNWTLAVAVVAIILAVCFGARP